ncbi:uncharacterized protein LOC121992915 isoform X3 [Zingiber officinale]|uniref:uncharacterized protein LOC121992915 isoform X3 n=1 Tax=Zingiber officinale TaxID=94328 RepID=UPI001C4C0CD2|nr:uncharacterized protein LOC121992915 isoform X3 [Zingiber officinale]
MGRPPHGGGPVFRFTQNEVLEMESCLQEVNNSIPPREIISALADKFSQSSERAGKIVVQSKQVWNWFQNRRYAQRAKLSKPAAKLNIVPMHREESIPFANVAAPISAPTGVYSTWEESNLAIQDLEHPYFKGFYSLEEAFTVARAKLGSELEDSSTHTSEGAAKVHRLDYLTLTQLKEQNKATTLQRTSKTRLASFPNTIPEDITIYVRSLTKKSTLQTFMELCEALKAFHKTPPDGMTIVYEAEFSPKLKCQKKDPPCIDFDKYSCQCQLIYSFRRANMDYETYTNTAYKGRIITPFTLLDYGLLHNYGSMIPIQLKTFSRN